MLENASNQKQKKLQIIYTILFIVIAPAIVQGNHWPIPFFLSVLYSSLNCALSSKGGKIILLNLPRCLLGTFSLLLVALAFAQLSIASLIYFKVFLVSVFKGNPVNLSLINVNHTQQIDYGVVIEQMTHQTVLEKYQVQSRFYPRKKKTYKKSNISIHKHFPIQANNTATVLYWDHVQKGVRHNGVCKKT